MEDLKLTTIYFDTKCSYLDGTGSYLRKLYCFRIVLYVEFYQRQIEYYNLTAHRTLTKDIGLILPPFLTEKRPKRGAIPASVLGGIASSIIGLVYEGILSFLHHKRHKAVKVMGKKTDLQHNKIHHLEDTVIMYSVSNSDTLKELTDTVHKMQNTTMWKERTFTGKINQMYQLYLNDEGVHHFCH